MIIKKESKFQKRIIELIEKIGDSIDMIEELCKKIMQEDFLLIDDEGHVENNIYSFVISHRKYNLLYNELRENLFEKLTSGYKIIKEQKFMDEIVDD